MRKKCGECEYLECTETCRIREWHQSCDGFCTHKQEGLPCDKHICDYFKQKQGE